MEFVNFKITIALSIFLLLVSSCKENRVDKVKSIDSSKTKNEKLKVQLYVINNENVKIKSKDSVSGNQEKMKVQDEKIVLKGKDYFVKEGDMLIKSENIIEYYQKQKSLRYELRDSTKMFVIVDGDEYNKPIQWKAGSNLKYCIFRKSFKNNNDYKLVTDNMNQASKDWENTCGIRFTHVSAEDNNENIDKIPNTVDFVVEQWNSNGRFIACSFLPGYPKEERSLLIDPSYYKCSFNKTGVLRHEIGHILGLRHEYIRSGAPVVCQDEDTTNTIDLTKYDPQSVMHFFCGDIGSKELAISDYDKEGAQILYGPPLPH